MYISFHLIQKDDFKFNFACSAISQLYVITYGAEGSYVSSALRIIIAEVPLDKYLIGSAQQFYLNLRTCKLGRAADMSAVQVGQMSHSLYAFDGQSLSGIQTDGSQCHIIVVVLMTGTQGQCHAEYRE